MFFYYNFFYQQNVEKNVGQQAHTLVTRSVQASEPEWECLNLSAANHASYYTMRRSQIYNIQKIEDKLDQSFFGTTRGLSSLWLSVPYFVRSVVLTRHFKSV